MSATVRAVYAAADGDAGKVRAPEQRRFFQLSISGTKITTDR